MFDHNHVAWGGGGGKEGRDLFMLDHSQCTGRREIAIAITTNLEGWGGGGGGGY